MFENLYMQAGQVTRQISAENPTGEKSGACRIVPDESLRFSEPAKFLGEGWKVNPFISLKRDTMAVLADINGPGCINQLWITSDLLCFNDLVLRIYWDGEETPSVETPLGSFYAMGHDFEPHTVNSAMVVVAPHRALCSYWQMPFRKNAKITLFNEGAADANIIAYKVVYTQKDIPAEAAYFHSQFRHSITSAENPEHIILDGVRGKGLYVGTYLAYDVLVSGWWGEGEVKFFIDGDGKYPTICDNGTEDYFGGAWNFSADGAFSDEHFYKSEEVFNTLYLGMPLAKADNPHGPRKYSLYRWHVPDPIGFSKDIKVTIQTLGWYPGRNRYGPCPAVIGSVSYWYQTEPHIPFPALPDIMFRCGM
jgi:hypothetical protein